MILRLQHSIGQRARLFSGWTMASPLELYMFDLQGFSILRGLLSPAEVAACNATIDRRKTEFVERTDNIKNAKESAFASNEGVSGSGGRLEHGWFLEWPQEDSHTFRKLLAHPHLVPRLTAFIGEGFRLDHLPLLLIQRSNVEGFDLHGGAVSESGRWNQELSYDFKGGQSRCSMLAVSVALTDVEDGQGGFVVAPGSHKANLPPPKGVLKNECPELLTQPSLQAGDAVLFSEATMHGALPWRGSGERRFALYRYGPAHVGYGRGYLEGWSDDMVAELTAAERAVLLPPYGTRLDRATIKVTGGGELDARVHAPRSSDKKEFDQKIFKKPYF